MRQLDTAPYIKESQIQRFGKGRVVSYPLALISSLRQSQSILSQSFSSISLRENNFLLLARCASPILVILLHAVAFNLQVTEVLNNDYQSDSTVNTEAAKMYLSAAKNKDFTIYNRIKINNFESRKSSKIIRDFIDFLLILAQTIDAS